MGEGFILEYSKGQGFFCKKAKEWKGSLQNRGKGRGVLANVPSFFLLTRRTEEGALGAGGLGAGGPGGLRRPGRRGKGGGVYGESIPLLDLRGGGP